MLSRGTFMDDLPVRGLADGRTPRPVAAPLLTGQVCSLSQRLARDSRFPPNRRSAARQALPRSARGAA
jgi:hypothetical protein